MSRAPQAPLPHDFLADGTSEGRQNQGLPEAAGAYRHPTTVFSLAKGKRSSPFDWLAWGNWIHNLWRSILATMETQKVLWRTVVLLELLLGYSRCLSLWSKSTRKNVGITLLKQNYLRLIVIIYQSNRFQSLSSTWPANLLLSPISMHGIAS